MFPRVARIAVVLLTVIAIIVAEFGQVGCQAACASAAAGNHIRCPISCCPVESCDTHKTSAKSGCCSTQDQAPGTSGGNGPKCPICQAPTRAIADTKKTTVPLQGTVAYDVPAAAIPKIISSESHRTELRSFDVIAALHPPLQILHCVWRN